MTSAAAVIVPAAAIGWAIIGRPAVPPEAIWLSVASGALEAAYFGFLAAAYRRGDLSVVYPIARGTAPLLAVLVGLILLGERLHATAAVGVVCLIIGIWTVRRPANAGSALTLALLTG